VERLIFRFHIIFFLAANCGDGVAVNELFYRSLDISPTNLNLRDARRQQGVLVHL
jgi:hypothetical protein